MKKFKKNADIPTKLIEILNRIFNNEPQKVPVRVPVQNKKSPKSK